MAKHEIAEGMSADPQELKALEREFGGFASSYQWQIYAYHGLVSS